MSEHQYDRDQALEAAGNHLARKMMDRLNILDTVPDGVYLADHKPEDCWFFHVASDHWHVGASHIIAVSKITGEIVFEGYCGE